MANSRVRCSQRSSPEDAGRAGSARTVAADVTRPKIGADRLQSYPRTRARNRPSRVKTCHSLYGEAVTSEFTIQEARTALASLRPTVAELIALRADGAELSAALAEGTASQLGGVPELKAAQARLDELLSTISRAGVQIKGIAPLLLDFPAILDGVPVLLCWLEGESELGWYHRVDLGFLGRRPLPDD